MRPVRRDDATNPRELPFAVDDAARNLFAALDGDACEVCGHGDDADDPIGHFKHPTRFGEYVLAHGDCGETYGLELA